MGKPLSIIQVRDTFGTEENCLAYLEVARWPDGVRCLKCNSDKVSKFVTNETEREIKNRKGETKTVRVPARHLYQCNAEGCRHQFSATTGTLFADTHLPLRTWFLAIALIANAKKGVSAKQMERDLGVNYRTAWHLNHRIREAMQDGTLGQFGGTCEVDATYFGGKKVNERRKRVVIEKQPIAGILQRGVDGESSKVRAFPVRIETRDVMMPAVRKYVDGNATVYTDDHSAYAKLALDFRHAIVRHSHKEYVRGNVHTNGIESFWSLFKRGVIGTFHQVSVKHLHRYLNEFSYRFNGRDQEDLFAMIVINLVIAPALRYKTLTANPSASSEPQA